MNNNIVNEKSFTLSDFFTRIYALVGMGITVSAIVSFLTLTMFQNNLITIINNYSWVLPVSWVLELVLVFVLSGASRKDSNIALPGFILYSALNGFTLSFTLAYYSLGSVTEAFIIAGIMFFGLAFYGSRTKKDLTGMGKAMRIGLFGIIIASILNLFIGGSGLSFLISIVSVVIFSGLVAYENQLITRIYESQRGQVTNGMAISMALNLYLDFINLFISLLRIFGSRD